MANFSAVADEVVARDQVEHVVRIEPLVVGLDMDLRVDIMRRFGGQLGLLLANPVGGVGDLALQVRDSTRS